jgi:NAD(P)-dependent dehydrogenase (short-subunit alcohol dehydrogenase family)
MAEIDSVRSVVITGASSGIGKACALCFADLGFTVFAGVRKEQDGAALQQESSGLLKPIILDVTRPTLISAAKEEVSYSLNGAGLMGLVNNAGIPLGGPIEFLSISDFRYQIEVNLIGAVAVTQAFMPLVRQARGRVVFISSLSGFIALPFMGPYAATKFGLRAVSDSLRVELRPWGISVSIIETGDVDTPIWEKSLAVIERGAREGSEESMEFYGPIVELKDRFQPHGIDPIEVARVVEHALTARRPKARYILGRDAKLLYLLRRLPNSIRDWLIASQMPEYGPLVE